MARLKLRPQFQLNDEQRIVLDRRAAVVRPRADDRRAAAGRRSQPRAGARRSTGRRRHHASLVARRISQWLEQTAREFLADPTRRAIVHPAPTARRCQLTTSRGPIHFYANSAPASSRQVPLEAFRRFQNDLRIRHGQAGHSARARRGGRRRAPPADGGVGATRTERPTSASASPRACCQSLNGWPRSRMRRSRRLLRCPIYDANGARTLQASCVSSRRTRPSS